MKNLLDRLKELIDRPAHFIAFTALDSQRLIAAVEAAEAFIAEFDARRQLETPWHHMGELRHALAALREEPK